jgi:GT2 family glycosyltransferase
MTVAAVVVTYRRPKLLMQCVRALRGQTHPVDEIIVVDNASGDGTAERVRQEFPDVTLRVLSENRGGAGGFHEGMRIAAQQDVDWIWVMDDDVEPEPDALEAIVESGLHRRDDTVGLASLNVFPNGTPQAGHAGNYDRVQMRIRSASVDEPIVPIEYSSFAGFLVRAGAVAAVGTPDTGYFIWGDDVEYAQRLSQIGRQYLVTVSRTVHHEAFAKSRKESILLSAQWRDRPLAEYWRTYYAHRNRLLTLRRHAASRAEWLAGCAVGLWRGALAAAAVLLFDRQKTLRLRLLADALVHGLTGRSGKYVDPSDWPPDSSAAG